MIVFNDLLKALTLDQLDENRFSGGSLQLPLPQVFGGQVLAQCLYAACQTVEEGRIAHSVHAYFLRPGKFDQPIDFEVDRIRDGRSFATRRVVASQNGQAIFNCSISFQVMEGGFEHASWPGDDLSSQAPSGDIRNISHPQPQEETHGRSLRRSRVFEPELVHILYDKDAANPAGPTAIWFRFPEAKGLGPLQQQLLSAFVSDYGLVSACVHPHGVRPIHKGMIGASLDHAIYFHDEVDLSEWHYYSLFSPWAGRGRGLARGEMFDLAGALKFSTTQETLIRYTGDMEQSGEQAFSTENQVRVNKVTLTEKGE